MKPIESFRGRYSFLSNFYPVLIRYDDMLFASAEDAFQSAKSTDAEVRKMFQSTRSSKEAKQLGRIIKLRSDWDDIKDKVMEDVVRIKFQNPKLRTLLLETEDAELIEGNSWNDKYWGVCKGTGENKLGKILMKIRKEIQDEESIH